MFVCLFGVGFFFYSFLFCFVLFVCLLLVFLLGGGGGVCLVSGDINLNHFTLIFSSFLFNFYKVILVHLNPHDAESSFEMNKVNRENAVTLFDTLFVCSC